MAAPEFDATGFVRSVLRSIVFYLSIIVISSMTMVKPAQAEGAVNPFSHLLGRRQQHWLQLQWHGFSERNPGL